MIRVSRFLLACISCKQCVSYDSIYCCGLVYGLASHQQLWSYGDASFKISDNRLEKPGIQIASSHNIINLQLCDDYNHF